jgi:DNA-binding XRE family transcriptional regulator
VRVGLVPIVLEDDNRRRSLSQICELNVLLTTFLKQRRLQIDPYATALGPYRRSPGRLGRRVTQQELAECVGVTREWYATLESRITARTSFALLDRLAAALMVTPEERTTLFDLALPELKISEAFGALRADWADGPF